MKLADDAGEMWLRENDPEWKPAVDFRYKELPIGMCQDVLETTFRGGRLVEHGAEEAARLCVKCSKPFAPRKSDHQFCGDLCRAEARRVYQRDLMRLRRAAVSRAA